MSKCIVITSIHHPSEAVRKFSVLDGYNLIVVGDKKTPVDWHCDHVDFLSVARQDASDYESRTKVPYNHYSRKMFGYLHAIRSGAEVIIDTDDDNIPKADWAFPEFDRDCNCLDENLGFVNIYELYTRQKIWPRGLPLRLVNSRTLQAAKLTRKASRIGVWQGLADGDPDVDAIYRLTCNAPCTFEGDELYALGRNTVTPFNTQNTAIRRELFALLYLPTFVTFRFTDILRGLIAQPIMWLYGFSLGFTGATVFQARNAHDYLEDFKSEIPMYLQGERVIELVSAAVSPGKSIADNLHDAYTALQRADIVCDKEIGTLEAWLTDCGRMLDGRSAARPIGPPAGVPLGRIA